MFCYNSCGDTMRIFYIFNIKDDIKKLTFRNAYDLFHTLEVIYYQNECDLETSYIFVKQLINAIDHNKLDCLLFQRYKDNYFYMKCQNVHKMHDIYRGEHTKLTIYKTYIKLETNVVKPRFLEELTQNTNFFVCDFEEKDYFYLDSLEENKIGEPFISNR